MHTKVSTAIYRRLIMFIVVGFGLVFCLLSFCLLLDSKPKSNEFKYVDTDRCFSTIKYYKKHDYPDGSVGWTALMTVTPIRIPCSTRFELPPDLHKKWLCVAVRGVPQHKVTAWSIDRGINAHDYQTTIEIDLMEGDVGRKHQALLFFHSRKE